MATPIAGFHHPIAQKKNQTKKMKNYPSSTADVNERSIGYGYRSSIHGKTTPKLPPFSILSSFQSQVFNFSTWQQNWFWVAFTA